MKRQRKWSQIAVFVAAFAALAGGTSAAHADFRMIQNFATGRVTSGSFVACNHPNGFAHWDTRSINIYHNTANQGSGKATALQAAMQSWTNVPDTSYALNYAGTTSAGFVTDGQNTLVWNTTSGCAGVSCVGLTALVLQSGQIIIESDVVFNDGLTWTTNGNQHDTESAAVHELGHLVGIGHSTCVQGPGTMCDGYFGTGQMRSLETEDMAALQCSENRYCATGATPAPPLSLTVTSEHCLGLNTVAWTGSCEGTTRYELYRSTNPSFSSQTLEYSGLNLSKLVSVSQTTYFRVRACNANGCGSYRVANAPAQYQSGCH